MTLTAEDMSAHLQTNGFGTEGTDIFIGYFPPNPDHAICVYDTAGRSSQIHGIDRPNFQVVVRDKSYSIAATTIQNIQTLLQNTTNTTINGTFYADISNLQSPFSAGRDVEERAEFKQNYVTIKR